MSSSSTASFFVVFLASFCVQAAGPRPIGSVILNGERTEVRWSDGDSFRFKTGPYMNLGTRLTGYNTLETFGPVHQWGEWTAEELFELAKSSSKVAASQEWTCTTDGKRDGYQRVLVFCPDLAVEMVRQGHALAYSVDEDVTRPEVLKAQKEAQEARRGMWKKGIVHGVITSVHSADEPGKPGQATYNRVVDVRTGKAEKREHQNVYGTCQKVCETLDGTTSCMTYVPFENRYRNKAPCLRKKK